MDETAKALRVVLAPNPSPLTGPGTNCFLLGRRQVAVIDPGPDLTDHRAAILSAVRDGGGEISHIFVTHAHLDHSPGAAALSRETGAPVLAFGPALAGRSAAMQQLAATGLIGGGEGLDAAFVPDVMLRDGESVASPEWSLTALHTPGHFGNHLCFKWDDLIFSGDIVLGWATTLISPPDGDLADYLRSLDRLAALSARRYHPAHGDPIEDPAARLTELAAHRRQRTAQIVAALRDGAADAETLARRIYTEVPPALLPAATRNVLAHLVALTGLGAVSPKGGDTAADAIFQLA